ncbi:hypothetical protein ZEAMMB73_Zm00001d040563 [Zea mays]|uniref:Uncharacterized protein n=1 Tax=Zea mays TaxID=4577 RepID=A0A1D6MRE6_MAIZE|nr:hypothetical protein ZEAMMB73_Zm00001d040563 [Zea mays]
MYMFMYVLEFVGASKKPIKVLITKGNKSGHDDVQKSCQQFMTSGIYYIFFCRGLVCSA